MTDPITDEQVNAAQAAHYAASADGKSWEEYLAAHPFGAKIRELSNQQMRLEIARAAAIKTVLEK